MSNLNVAASFSYCCLYNFLDFPAGIYPVTKETEADQAKLDEEYRHKDVLCKLMKEVNLNFERNLFEVEGKVLRII